MNEPIDLKRRLHQPLLLLVPPPGAIGPRAPVVPDFGDPAPRYGLGINLSGLEFKQETLPGIPYHDYFPVEPHILDYYVEKGFRYARVPFRWERLQPDLGGAFDPGYLALIEQSVALVNSRGMAVTLDCHNFGARVEGPIGGAAVQVEDLCDLWKRLALLFRHLPEGCMAYDLMTEPVHACDWPPCAQATIDAIRQVDRTATIVVQGKCWSDVASWEADNFDLHLTDPARRLVLSAHLFPDEFANGIDLKWRHQIDYGLTVDVMVERTRGFVRWCRKFGFRPQIGQFGVGNDDPGWNTTLDNFLRYCQENEVAVIAWVGGRLSEDYAMSLQPRADGSDAKQMATLVGRMTLDSTPAPQEEATTGPARAKHLVRHGYDRPRFLGYDFERFALKRPTIVRYGVAGTYVTRLLQPRAEPYVVLPSTFDVGDLVPNMEKAAYAMPEGTPINLFSTPNDPPLPSPRAA